MALIEVIGAVAPAVVTGGFGVFIAKIGLDTRRQVTPSNGVKTSEHIESVAFDVAIIKREQVRVAEELVKHTASDAANFEELRRLCGGDDTNGTSK